jgi:hypothetical protein
MWPLRRRLRTAPGAPARVLAPPGSKDQVVRAAETIVGRAWATELLRRHDAALFAVNAAYEDCEAAYRLLTAAQRAGDPRRISLAHAAWEQALKVRGDSTAVSDRTHRIIRRELASLARAGRVGPVPALVRGPERGRAASTAAPRGGPGRLLRRIRPGGPGSGAVRRWLGRFHPRRANRHVLSRR